MTIHSSILAWRIPWVEEPSGLQSMRSQRVWHDSSGLAPAPVLSCNIYWALRLTWMGTERKVSEWKFKRLLEGWYWRLKLCLTKQQEGLEGQPDLGVQRKHILWSPRFLRLRELQQRSFIAHSVFSLGIFSVVTHIYVMISLWNTVLDRRKYFQLTLCS